MNGRSCQWHTAAAQSPVGVWLELQFDDLVERKRVRVSVVEHALHGRFRHLADHVGVNSESMGLRRC